MYVYEHKQAPRPVIASRRGKYAGALITAGRPVTKRTLLTTNSNSFDKRKKKGNSECSTVLAWHGDTRTGLCLEGRKSPTARAPSACMHASWQIRQSSFLLPASHHRRDKASCPFFFPSFLPHFTHLPAPFSRLTSSLSGKEKCTTEAMHPYKAHNIFTAKSETKASHASDMIEIKVIP